MGKLYEINPTFCGNYKSLESAVDILMGPDTLRTIHQDLTMRIENWRDDDTRIYEFFVDIPENIPKPIRNFFNEDRVRVTTKQKRQLFENEIVIDNRLKMHFVGAELFKIKPRFVFTRDARTGAVNLSGNVSHSAVLPPPFNVIAENFMTACSKRELERMHSISDAIVTMQQHHHRPSSQSSRISKWIGDFTNDWNKVCTSHTLKDIGTE